MKRRRFMRLASASATGLALHNPVSKLLSQPTHPNVLFIEYDDMNDWVGYLGGHPNSLTPNLDAFAQTAVQFNNAHACAAACNPSRTAIFTGLLPSTSGIYGNTQDWEDVLGIDYPTMPDRFQQAGYTNVLAGKFYHASVDEEAWDARFPYIKYHNLMGQDPFLPMHPHNGLNQPICGDFGADFFWGANDVSESLMQDSRRKEFVLGILDDELPEPFFMAYGTNVPHYPNTIPRKYFERFNLSEIELPPYLLNDLDDIPERGLSLIRQGLHNQTVLHKSWKKGVQAYLAAIAFADEMTGQILEALDNSPYADNTIVIITSDHGHHLGEKRHWRKWTLWERSLHVPLLIHVPGMTQPGTVCDQAVSLVDLYPTLIDLCNLDAVPDLDGASLSPQLLDPLIPTSHPAISSHSPGNHTVRSDRYRLISYYPDGEELYDHQNDPNEWYNQADNPDYADIKAELIQWLPTGGGSSSRSR